MEQNTLSLENAINALKAEILSPDWTLSPRRNATSTNAMQTLNSFFSDRRYTKGLIAIAKQLLLHVAEPTKKPGSIDLLKETMAHIVTIYEQDPNDNNAEKKLCAQSLRRFKKLDIPIKTTKQNTNKFAIANSNLKQDVVELQAVASQFDTLSSTKQVQALLTIQSIIAETKALHKVMATSI